MKCRSCGADILWVKTPNGKSMPVDAKPVDCKVGSVLVGPDGNAQIFTKAQKELLPPGSMLHISHFATCPNAKQHRKA